MEIADFLKINMLIKKIKVHIKEFNTNLYHNYENNFNNLHYEKT